jgi:transposase
VPARRVGAKTQALGRSRGGLTTKIHMLADALGRPGQAHDVTAAPALLDGAEGESVIADGGYDTNEIRTIIAQAGMQAVIPSRRSRRTPIPHDPILYKARNRIERCFNKLNHFRRFATRFPRRDIHFLSFIHLATAMLWMR